MERVTRQRNDTITIEQLGENFPARWNWTIIYSWWLSNTLYLISHNAVSIKRRYFNTAFVGDPVLGIIIEKLLLDWRVPPVIILFPFH